jgi:hypothetical protein
MFKVLKKNTSGLLFLPGPRSKVKIHTRILGFIPESNKL